MILYSKKAFTSEDLVKKVKDRGLIFSESEQGSLYEAIKNVGYYRLTGFFHPFQEKNIPGNPFKKGTSLSYVLDSYNFDTNLRALSGKALEKIEISMQTYVCEYMCKTNGPHWYEKPEIFNSDQKSLDLLGEKEKTNIINNQNINYKNFIKQVAKNLQFDLDKNSPKDEAINKNSNQYLRHYYKKYSHPSMPPAWVLRECASFGFWATLYSNLNVNYRNSIAQKWTAPDNRKIPEPVLKSWLRSLSIFRNRCAHHNRITNRTFPFAPTIPSGHYKEYFTTESNDLRSLFLIIHLLLYSIEKDSNWRSELLELFNFFDDKIDIGKATNFDKKNKSWKYDNFWTMK